jgi:hypothetical protein
MKLNFQLDNSTGTLLKYDEDLYSLLEIDSNEKIAFGKQSYIFKKLLENGNIFEYSYNT